MEATRTDHGPSPSSTGVVRRIRPDGSTEYRCSTCGRLVMVGKFIGWAQAMCHKCKRERRFNERDME